MIKVKAGATGAEQLQYTDRAKKLGLDLKNGQIDPKSAENVKGGLPAVQALLKDGVLDGEGLAQLRQNKGFVASLLGRDLPISQKQSQGVRAVAMEMKGAQALIAKTLKQISFTQSIDNPMLLAVNERLAKVCDDYSKWVIKDGEMNLSQVDPKAAKELAEALGSMSGTLSQYAQQLSNFRSAIIDANPTGIWQRMGINAITTNLMAALEGSDQFRQLAQALSRPAGGAAQVSPKVQDLGNDFARWQS
jgi:hypothetical protein